LKSDLAYKRAGLFTLEEERERSKNNKEEGGEDIL